MNSFQRLVVEQIFNHVIPHKKRTYENKNDQLFLYVKNENEINRNRDIQSLKIEFALLRKRNKFVFITSTDCTMNNINERIIYISLNIITRDKNMHND